MSAPIQPEKEPHPAQYLQYLRETGQREEAALFEQYLTETGQAHHIATANRQAEFASGRLARRMASENALDAANAEGPSYRQQVAGGIASLAKDIPGAEALQAGGRMLASRLSMFAPAESYREALRTIQEGEASAPAVVRNANRLIGGTVASAAMPGNLSPTAAGALYGGALNALSADPDQAMGDRVLNTALGATVGGTLGKVGDVVTTGLRAKLTPNLGDARTALKAARSAESGPLYAEAARQGVGQTSTPEIHAALQRPEVQAILDDIGTLDAFKGLYPDDPKVLQEIVRRLSEEQGPLVARLQQANPTRSVSARAARDQFQTVKNELVDAMSAGPNAPMPAQRPAMTAYAEGSRRLDALTRGQRAAAIETGAGSNPENLERFGRQALLEFLDRSGPDVRAQAAQGVLGFGRRKLEQAGVTGLANPMRGMARNFLLDGGDLLRAIEGPMTATTEVAPRTVLDLLRQSGVVAATPNLGSP